MDISYHRYGLKLRGVAGGNARSPRRVLEGFLIRADGGYGCVQPWPELGDPSMEKQWQAIKSGGATRLLERALECASVDAAARRKGRSLFQKLPVPPSHMTVTGEADFVAVKEEGFTAVKLKGGLDWREVLDRMRAAVAAGLRVRVDFNGTLDMQKFLDFTREAEEVRDWVDFVEDPVPYVGVEWQSLREKTGWRLALDWVIDEEEMDGGFDVRVWKPASNGMGNQLALGPSVVVTSYMDHALGQTFGAWEAGRDSGRLVLAGLLTHRSFERDAFTERLAAAGPDWVSPGGTGLGFDDLLEALPWIPVGSSGVVNTRRVLQNPRDPLPGGGPALEAGEVGFATSGSTGKPSVVVHRLESLEASARAVNEWLAAKPEDVWLRVLPDFHVGGYQIGVRASLAGSRKVVDEAKWDAARFVGICGEEGVTLSALVPAQVVDLVKLAQRSPAALRAVVVGGGALEDDWKLAALALGWPVLRSYGATEAASQVATEKLGKPGAMVLLPHWEARVMVPEAEIHDECEGAGLLELRGPGLALGRFVRTGSAWHRQTLTDEEGWWRTADRVVLSGRELRFSGRSDRVVKVLGELVNLESVEQVLAAAGLEVGTFVVAALPEARRGMELVLVVETGDEDARRTAAWPRALEVYQAGAAPFARIGRVVGVPRLPRSQLGKVRFGAVPELIPPRAVPG